MGLANLIPGVSGGTMILALGLYEEFVGAVADLTALRLRPRRMMFLALLLVSVAVSLVGLAWILLWLLFHYQPLMYALFIGLTLGGAPLLLRELKPVSPAIILPAGVGFGAMAGIFGLQNAGLRFPQNMLMDFVSGLVGAITMVLPGVSGSYLLLVLNQYYRVINALKTTIDGARGGDFELLQQGAMILIPVGIGAVIGIVGLSNLLKWLLTRYHRTTLGVLLGLLLGSVLGLWPFDREPSDDALESQPVAELHAWAVARGVPQLGAPEEWDDSELLAVRVIENWSERTSTDLNATAAGSAIGLVIIGFAVTVLLGTLQRDKPTAQQMSQSSPQSSPQSNPQSTD